MNVYARIAQIELDRRAAILLLNHTYLVVGGAKLEVSNLVIVAVHLDGLGHAEMFHRYLLKPP